MVLKISLMNGVDWLSYLMFHVRPLRSLIRVVWADMPLKSIDDFSFVNALFLNKSAAEEFREPYGILLEGSFEAVFKRFMALVEERNPSKIISVGDYVTSSLLRKNISPDLGVVDLKIERKAISFDFHGHFDRFFKVDNPAGTITSNAWLTIQYALALDLRSIIFVDGEEDLLALPSVLCSPLGSLVLFGVPKKGLMVVPIDFKARAEAFRLLKFFSLKEG